MIESKDNQYIKLVRYLQRKKGREETGLFLAEGRRLIGDLVESGLSLELLLYSEDAGDECRSAWAAKAKAAFSVADPLLEKLSEAEHGQGVIAAFTQKQWGPEDFFASPSSFAFIISGVQDPGNLGAMMRNSAAAGVDGLFLTDDTAEPYNPKTVRGSMGAIARLPVFRDSAASVYDRLKAAGFQFYLADMAGALPYWELPQDVPLAVIMGNEGTGPSDFWRQKADDSLAIPLFNRVESLNVAMAQGIIAFDHMRRRVGK